LHFRINETDAALYFDEREYSIRGIKTVKTALPSASELLGKTVGRIYNKDVLSFDIYTLMPQYSGKTLIIHGSDDSLVPLSYSERAVKTFPDAKLIKLDGEKHVFYGNAMRKAADDAVQFVQSIIGEKRHQAR